MFPLVSIIIPVYNVEQYLDKCVESVIRQTYSNLEIILVDDGSPDNCPEMCDRYSKIDPRILVIHKKNGGLSEARNAGIDIAKGEYISFIDSDDYVEDNYVKILVDEMIKYNADISCGKHNVIYSDKVIKHYTGKRYVLKPEDALDMLLYHNDMDVSAWAKLYKKSLFDKVRFPVGRLYEDAATTYKLIDKSSVIVLNSIPVYNYIIRDNSITNNSFSEKKLDLITSTKEMTDFIRKKYTELSSGCDRRLVYAYLSTLTQTIKDNSVSSAIITNLSNFIKENGKHVLKDLRAPKRDKVGILCVMLGYKFFKKCWNMYDSIRRQK